MSEIAPLDHSLFKVKTAFATLVNDSRGLLYWLGEAERMWRGHNPPPPANEIDLPFGTWHEIVRWSKSYATAWNSLETIRGFLEQRWGVQPSTLWIDQFRATMYCFGLPLQMNRDPSKPQIWDLMESVFSNIRSLDEQDENQQRIWIEARRKAVEKARATNEGMIFDPEWKEADRRYKEFSDIRLRQFEEWITKLKGHPFAWRIFNLVRADNWKEEYRHWLYAVEKTVATIFMIYPGTSAPQSPSSTSTKDGEWSNSMTKKEMQGRLGLTPKTFASFIKLHPVKPINRQLFQMRLDGMDARTRRQMEAKD